MKRVFMILLVLALLFVSASAEDLASLSVDQLRQLVLQVNAEIVSRQEWSGSDVPAGFWVVGQDIPAGVYSISVADKSGAYLTVSDASGRYVTYGGIRKEKDAIGKIELKDGFTVEIDGGPLHFAPPVVPVF